MWQKHPNLPIEVNPNGCTKNLKTMNETFGRNARHGYKRISLTVSKNKVKDYQEFLFELGIDYDLFEKEIDDTKYIFTKFPSGKEANFFSIMSKGTIALSLFFMCFREVNSSQKVEIPPQAAAQKSKTRFV